MVKSLNVLDIVITIFNQEQLIERVLFGIFYNTTTPFNLILVFDGCTDRTKPRASAFIKKRKPKLLRKLITREAPNVYETRANNIGFKLTEEDYMITVQDDMVIKEHGWERRLTLPLRRYDDVVAVTARAAQDIKRIDAGHEEYMNCAARELGTLPRNLFAIRDVINRGPVAFRMDYLKRLNYLNEHYAPCNLDDADLSLRAWTQYGWKCGSFWIDYLSRHAWSKVYAPDSTMKVWESQRKNEALLVHDHQDYLLSMQKHTEDRLIEEQNIDYIIKKSSIYHLMWFLRSPQRYTKDDIVASLVAPFRAIFQTTKRILKPPLASLMRQIGFEQVSELGIKRSLRGKHK